MQLHTLPHWANGNSRINLALLKIMAPFNSIKHHLHTILHWILATAPSIRHSPIHCSMITVITTSAGRQGPRLSTFGDVWVISARHHKGNSTNIHIFYTLALGIYPITYSRSYLGDTGSYEISHNLQNLDGKRWHQGAQLEKYHLAWNPKGTHLTTWRHQAIRVNQPNVCLQRL